MVDRYWVGGTGNWNSTNTGNWSATDGGASGASAPVAGDDAYFTANSDAGAPFTVTITATGPTIRNLTISGLDQTMDIAGTTAFAVQGNISLPASNLTWSATGTLNLSGSASSRTILTNGVTINSLVNFTSAGSDWTLQSALTLGATRNINLTAGTVTTAGYAVTSNFFIAVGSLTRVLNLGASTITCVGSSSAWNFAASTNLTLNAGTSTIILTRVAAKTFDGGGLTYNIVSQGGAGDLTIVSSNTFADIQNAYKSTGAAKIIFTAGTTQTVSAFTASGESGRVLTLESTVAASAFTLSKASGTVTVDYCSIKDSTATGGATWRATNSTNVSGNTGWTFETGANVIVPLASIALAAYAPVIATGANVSVPASNIALSAFAPTVSGGVSVHVPVSSISLQAFAPSVGSLVIIAVPLTTLNVTAYAPTITTVPLSALPRVTLTGRFILPAS